MHNLRPDVAPALPEARGKSRVGQQAVRPVTGLGCQVHALLGRPAARSSFLLPTVHFANEIPQARFRRWLAKQLVQRSAGFALALISDKATSNADSAGTDLSGTTPTPAKVP